MITTINEFRNNKKESTNEVFKYDKVESMFANDRFSNLSTADTILSSSYMVWKNSKRDRLWYDIVSLGLSVDGIQYVSELDGPTAEFLLNVANSWAKDEKEGILKSIEKY